MISGCALWETPVAIKTQKFNNIDSAWNGGHLGTPGGAVMGSEIAAALESN